MTIEDGRAKLPRAVSHPRIIVALDVPHASAARGVVERLGSSCDFYKVGLELYTAAGPDIVLWLRDAGKEVFVDLKLHDIPNTVRAASRNIARLGASLLTVHASGGQSMVAAAVDGVGEGTDGPLACGVLGVTVLTSFTSMMLSETWGRGDPIHLPAEVVRLAGQVAAGGGAGVVCSGHEVASVREAFGDRLGLLVPGLRLPGDATGDQQRIVTPGAAAAAGARWLVLGRPITSSADPIAALEAVRASVNTALSGE